MPSTIIYKPGFPANSTPVETSASVGSDGLVTGSAVFVVRSDSTDYPVNSSISPSFFTSLGGTSLQGLFVESRSLERRGGLCLLRVSVVGAVNPPIFQENVETSPRSFTKSITSIDEETKTFSFDYLAETISVSTVFVSGAVVNFNVRNPNVISQYNARGTGITLQWNPATGFSAPPTNVGDFIIAYPRILTTESREQRGRIVRLVRSAQFVYE